MASKDKAGNLERADILGQAPSAARAALAGNLVGQVSRELVVILGHQDKAASARGAARAGRQVLAASRDSLENPLGLDNQDSVADLGDQAKVEPVELRVFLDGVALDFLAHQAHQAPQVLVVSQAQAAFLDK